MMGNNGNGASSTKEQSNLGVISGIGPTYADALCEAEICCVEQLAAHEPADLLNSLCSLREQGRFKVLPKTADVQSWVDQARVAEIAGADHLEALHKAEVGSIEALAQSQPDELADAISSFHPKDDPSPPPELDEVRRWIRQARNRGASTGHNQANADPEASHEPRSSPRKRQEHAMFSVFFGYETSDQEEKVWKTRVIDDTMDESEELEGIDLDGLIDWILERADLPDDAEPILVRAQRVTPTQLALPQIEILATDINPSADAPGRTVVAEAQFELSSPLEETGLEAGIPFSVLFRTVHLETGAIDLVGVEQGRIEPQTRTYHVEHRFPTPDFGEYEWEVIVLLLAPGDVAVFRGPGRPFRVVPR